MHLAMPSTDVPSSPVMPSTSVPSSPHDPFPVLPSGAVPSSPHDIFLEASILRLLTFYKQTVIPLRQAASEIDLVADSLERGDCLKARSAVRRLRLEAAKQLFLWTKKNRDLKAGLLFESGGREAPTRLPQLSQSAARKLHLFVRLEATNH